MSVDTNPVVRLINQLSEEFKGTFSEETIQKYVTESAELLDHPRLHDFVPLFLYRFSRDRLRALAQADNLLSKDMPEVLFVCIHNAGRSQMAAAILDRLSEGHV